MSLLFFKIINSIFFVLKVSDFSIYTIKDIFSIFGIILKIKFKKVFAFSKYKIKGIIDFKNFYGATNAVLFFQEAEIWKQKVAAFFFKKKRKENFLNENSIFSLKLFFQVKILIKLPNHSEKLKFYEFFQTCWNNFKKNSKKIIKKTPFSLKFDNFFEREYFTFSCDGEFSFFKKIKIFIDKRINWNETFSVSEPTENMNNKNFFKTKKYFKKWEKFFGLRNEKKRKIKLLWEMLLILTTFAFFKKVLFSKNKFRNEFSKNNFFYKNFFSFSEINFVK